MSSSNRDQGKLDDPEDMVALNPLELEAYMPFYLGAIANRWTALSSKIYRDRFDLGIGDWRVLASLAALSEASSLEIGRLVKMDTGAVSRSIRLLEERELVAPIVGRFLGRTKPYRLTNAGRTCFNEMNELAIAREAQFLEPLAAGERDELLRLLGRVYDGLDAIDT